MQFERQMRQQQLQNQMPQANAMWMGEMMMIQQLMQQHQMLHNQLPPISNNLPQAQPEIQSLLNSNPGVQVQETKSRTIVFLLSKTKSDLLI